MNPRCYSLTVPQEDENAASEEQRMEENTARDNVIGNVYSEGKD